MPKARNLMPRSQILTLFILERLKYKYQYQGYFLLAQIEVFMRSYREEKQKYPENTQLVGVISSIWNIEYTFIDVNK